MTTGSAYSLPALDFLRTGGIEKLMLMGAMRIFNKKFTEMIPRLNNSNIDDKTHPA